MADLSSIQPHAEVIGADGVHVGTVDHVDGARLKLTKMDSVDHHHHYIDGALVDAVENGRVRLSADAATAITLEEEDLSESERLDEGLEETFPASDPVSAKHIT